MKLNKKYKLESACASTKSDTLVSIQHPWIPDEGTILDGKAVATDGKILAVVPVNTWSGEKGTRIHRMAIKNGRSDAKGQTSIDLSLNRTTTRENITGDVHALPEINRLPNVSPLLPDRTKTPALRIALDLRLLNRLAEAIGSEELILEFQGPKDAVCVSPFKGEGNDGAFGIIMPMNIA